MILDKHGFRCAAAECFDADRTGPGENIEEMGAFDLRAEHIEERFAETVARGAQRKPLERLQQPGAILACNNAHAKKVA